MKATQLRRILRKGRKFNCAKCPIPQATCRKLSVGLHGEEFCLLRIVLREILIFRCEDRQPQPGKPIPKRILKGMGKHFAF